MATFSTDKSKSIQTGTIKQETLVDETAGSEAAAFGKGFADLGKTAITFFDDKAKKGVKDSFSINQAALQTLATRKEQGRIGKLPGLDDTSRTPDQIRDERIDLLIRDNLGNNVSDKIVGDTRKRFDLIAAASAKGGGLTQTDLGVIINSDLKLMMRDNPGFEEVIREQATKSLGFDPTHSPMKQALAILAPKTETVDPVEAEIQRRAIHVYGGDVNASRNHHQTLEEAKLVKAQGEIQNSRNAATQADSSAAASADMVVLSSIMQQEYATRVKRGLVESTPDEIIRDTQFINSYYANAIATQNRLAVSSGVDNSRTVDNLVKQRDFEVGLIEDVNVLHMQQRSDFNKAIIQAGVESNSKYYAAQALFGDEYMASFINQYNSVKNDPDKLEAAMENFPRFSATVASAKQFESYLDSEFRMREGKPASGTGEDQKVDLENVDMVLNGQTTKDTDTINDLKYLEKEYGVSSAVKAFTNTSYTKLKASGKTDSIKAGQQYVTREASALQALLPTLTGEQGTFSIAYSLAVDPKTNRLVLSPKSEGSDRFLDAFGMTTKRKYENYIVRANNTITAATNLDDGTGNMFLDPNLSLSLLREMLLRRTSSNSSDTRSQ